MMGLDVFDEIFADDSASPDFKVKLPVIRRAQRILLERDAQAFEQIRHSLAADVATALLVGVPTIQQRKG
jgi:hypothetical protein